jgi:hypothetical protein
MSCAFLSLSHFINGINENQLRNIICDFLSTNPKLIDDLTAEQCIWESNIPLPEYVANMRNPCTWGGAIEIISFCQIFNIDVLIKQINAPEQKDIEFKSKTPTNIIIKLLYNGNHYEPFSAELKAL